MNGAEFVELLEYGQEAEMTFREVFQSNGYSVLPVYEKVANDFKGPRITMPVGELVAPDLFIFGNGEEPRWVEIKMKDSATWHYNGQKWCVGIDVRLFDDYVKIDAQTPFRVWILFLLNGGVSKNDPQEEKSPEGFFGAPIRHLKDRESHRPHDIAYFPVSSLVRYSSVRDIGKVRFRFDFTPPRQSSWLKHVRSVWNSNRSDPAIV